MFDSRYDGSSDHPKASCRVFNTTYNPERVRIGSHIMRQRLKGASVASYYPPRIGTIAQLRSLYPENELLDEEEEDWLEHLNVARSRGKSVPKKKRTAAGMFVEKHRTSVPGADMMQNRRSSTRGSRRRTPRDIPTEDTVYLLYKRALDGVLSGWQTPGLYSNQRHKITITIIRASCRFLHYL